jgi:hypothetical protein
MNSRSGEHAGSKVVVVLLMFLRVMWDCFLIRIATNCWFALAARRADFMTEL